MGPGAQAPLRPKLDRPLNERLLPAPHPLATAAAPPPGGPSQHAAHPHAARSGAPPPGRRPPR